MIQQRFTKGLTYLIGYTSPKLESAQHRSQAPNFGIITSARTMRELQFGLKYSF